MSNAALNEIFRQLNEQREEINALKSQNSGLQAVLKTLQTLTKGGGGQQINWPEEFAAGIIKYPGYIPFTLSYEVEMTSKSKSPFGVAVEESTGSIKFDIEDPVFLMGLTASIQKSQGTITQEELADPGIGYFRPLSMDCCNPGTPLGPLDDQDHNRPYQYQCDFEWKAHWDAKQRVVTYGWMPSTLLQTDNKKGFRLPIQQEAKKNETLTIKAQPLRAVQNLEDIAENQGYILKFQVHTYKMLPNPQAVIDAMNEAGRM